jgi:predicted phage baseplate assembly protein
VDANDAAVIVSGSANFAAGTLAHDPARSWTEPLAMPVRLWGNMLSASRGETVADEIVGSGDASQANQRFALQRGPLTYFADPSATTPHGLSSSLTVVVDGIRWSEVPHFAGAGPADAVYVVRDDDAGRTWIITGDGEHGARLPTGSGNVVATYRAGSGAAVPPANAVKQLAGAVSGLRSVRNPLGAFGGSDADPPRALRKLAPRSALLLGRAVSIDDIQTAAALTPGVAAAAARWGWSQLGQRPQVCVWYIGDSSLAATVSARLRALCDPSAAIEVIVARRIEARLALEVAIDARHARAPMLRALTALLLDADAGLLVPANLGIGATFFQSELFAKVHAVPGVVAVTSLLWNGEAAPAYGVSPGQGAYFDLMASTVVAVRGGIDG